MSIEIRELVIRATVDEAAGRSQSAESDGAGSGDQGNCEEKLEMIMQLISEKKER